MEKFWICSWLRSWPIYPISSSKIANYWGLVTKNKNWNHFQTIFGHILEWNRNFHILVTFLARNGVITGQTLQKFPLTLIILLFLNHRGSFVWKWKSALQVIIQEFNTLSCSKGVISLASSYNYCNKCTRKLVHLLYESHLQARVIDIVIAHQSVQLPYKIAQSNWSIQEKRIFIIITPNISLKEVSLLSRGSPI